MKLPSLPNWVAILVLCLAVLTYPTLFIYTHIAQRPSHDAPKGSHIIYSIMVDNNVPISCTQAREMDCGMLLVDCIAKFENTFFKINQVDCAKDVIEETVKD